MSRFACSLAFLLLVSSAPVSAGPITDPVGDFIGTYTGRQNGDLDVVSANVTYNGSSFTLTATMNGPIGFTKTGSTLDGLYVWGFNRGAGTAGFASIGHGGVLFDRVVLINANGTGSVAGTALAPGAVTISGNTISAIVPASLLPPNGFAPEAFTWNLWPRDTTQAGNAAISDFAPDNSNAALTVTPEPASVVALLAGVGVLALRARRRVGALAA